MNELDKKTEYEVDQLTPKRMPWFQRGIFWMFVGVFTTCGACVWLFAQRGTYLGPGRPIAFYIALAGFLIYIIGRVLQVIQKKKAKGK